MKWIIVALLLVATVTASEVVVATSKNFDEVIKGDFVLMQFYAPWCGHCKKLAPEFEVAAIELKGVATLAKLDATVEKEIAEKFKVEGFPTLKIFRNGEMTGDYESDRNSQAIVKYIKIHTGPAIHEATTKADFEELIKQYPVVFVYVASDFSEVFAAVAKKKRGVATFIHVSEASITEDKEGSIFVLKTGEDRVNFAFDTDEEASLLKFVEEESVAIFAEMGPTNYKQYIDRKLPIAWLFTTPSNEDVKEACRRVAVSFKSKVSFVWIDSDKFGGMAVRLGLPEDKFPGFVIDSEGKHFPFPAETITAEAIELFVNKFISGTMDNTVRSETAPEDHTVDGLTTIVGSTFDELVSKTDVDVLIEFYAPWCGHCKQLAPIYAKVAGAFAKDNIRIAQIDATANDFDQAKFAVQGFPTIFFVPKDTHDPTTYEGGRTENEIMEFVKSKI